MTDRQNFANVTANDVMEREVVKLSPEMSLHDAWKVFTEHRISGAPVVNEEGILVSVLSQSDLLRESFSNGSTGGTCAYHYSLSWWGEDFIPNREEQLDKLTVEEAMNPYVITASPEDSVPALAADMRSRRIHRLIITNNKRVVGVVSTSSLLRHLENN